MVEKQQIVEEEKTTKEQIGQTNVSLPNLQEQGVTQIMVIDQGRSKESKDIPKEKDQEAFQALINLPTSVSPTKVL